MKKSRVSLLEEAKDKKIVLIILKCLLKANDFYHSIELAEFKLDSVGITLALTPDVKINLSKK